MRYDIFKGVFWVLAIAASIGFWVAVARIVFAINDWLGWLLTTT